MFCGFAIRSREIVMYYGLGDYKSPGLIGRTFFYDGLQIRRDAWRVVWDAWEKAEKRLAGG